MKKNNKKAFTLAELLVVVAIIAVLAAISIPVFSGQLEKAKEATDIANIRAAYAECTTAMLTNDTAYYTSITAEQETDGWVSDVSNVAGTDLASIMTTTTGTLYVCVDKAGTLTVVTAAPTTGYTPLP